MATWLGKATAILAQETTVSAPSGWMNRQRKRSRPEQEVRGLKIRTPCAAKEIERLAELDQDSKRAQEEGVGSADLRTRA